MKATLPPILVALMILGVGTYYSGIYSERWGVRDSERLDRFTRLIENVPTEFGDWTSEEQPLTEKEFKLTNCTNYMSRNYTNQKTGKEISVYLVCGTARHICVHSPDWCYQGAGFQALSKPTAVTLSTLSEMDLLPEFLMSSFSKETPQGIRELRILWTYSDDGTWIGPESQKFHFAGRPALYKLYLINHSPPANEDVERGVIAEFAKELLPILNQELFREDVAPAGDDEAVAASEA